MSELREFGSRDALAQALAERIANCLRRAIDLRQRAGIALSGGSTPIDLFRYLAQHTLDWQRVTATLVDERWVDPDSPDSNEGLAHQHLQQDCAKHLRLVGLKSDHTSPEQALASVEARLEALPWPLDCVHLGMGLDGHTASWFADAPEYEAMMAFSSRESSRQESSAPKLMAVHPRTAPWPRISLSPRAVLSAREIVIQLNGDDKRVILDRALAGDTTLPITRVLQSNAPVTIYWAP